MNAHIFPPVCFSSLSLPDFIGNYVIFVYFVFVLEIKRFDGEQSIKIADVSISTSRLFSMSYRMVWPGLAWPIGKKYISVLQPFECAIYRQLTTYFHATTTTKRYTHLGTGWQCLLLSHWSMHSTDETPKMLSCWPCLLHTNEKIVGGNDPSFGFNASVEHYIERNDESKKNVVNMNQHVDKNKSRDRHVTQ